MNPIPRVRLSTWLLLTLLEKEIGLGDEDTKKGLELEVVVEGGGGKDDREEVRKGVAWDEVRKDVT